MSGDDFPLMDERQFQRVSHAAHRLNLPAAWLEREAKNGNVPTIQIGKDLFVDVEQVRDTLLRRAEEARTRRGMTDDEINEAMAKDPAAYRCPCSFQHPPHDNCDGNPGAVFGRSSTPPAASPPAPDDLRAVAEELVKVAVMTESDLNGRVSLERHGALLKKHGWDGVSAPCDFRLAHATAALSRARAMGLGGGK